MRALSVAVVIGAMGLGPVAALHAQDEQATTDGAETATIAVDPISEPTESQDGSTGDERQGLGATEIVVTAQKKSESLQDVPIAISAFSGDALRDLGVNDTRDLGHIVPGFSYSESGLDNPVYTLRGIGFNDASRTASSTVGVYGDEVSLPYPYMTKGASLDLERIEVLKGPQGTLYGRNTTGGAVNYIANKPSDSWEYGVDGTYGRFETGDLEGYVSGPLGDDLGIRFAAREAYAGKGWQSSSTRSGDSLGKVDKQAARLSLAWRPIDDLNSAFTVDWWRDGSDPQAPQAYAISAQAPVGGNLTLNPQVSGYQLIARDTNDQRVADWSPDVDWHLDNQFWMGATRNYWDVSDQLALAFIGSYIDYRTRGSQIPQSGLPVLNSEKSQDTDAHAWSLELRASGNLIDGQLGWLAGLYGTQDFVEDVQRQYFDTISALFNTVPGVYPIANSAILRGKQTSKTAAAFTNIDWTFNDAIKLTAGARYTRERRVFDGCGQDDPEAQGVAGLINVFNALSLSQGGTGGGRRGDCFTIDSETRNPQLIHGRLPEHNLSGKVTLDWTPTDDQLVYATIGRGFKSGSFPILGASAGTQYEPVLQERLNSFEIGSKSQLLDRMLSVNTAVFYYDYKNKQLLGNFADPVFGPLPKLYNAPKSRVWGAELEVQARPVRGLYLSAAGSLLRTKIVEFIGTDSEGNENVDFSGNELNFSPPFQLVFLANYETSLTSSMNLILGADYNHVAKTSSDLEADPLYDIPAYDLVNLRVGVGEASGRWKLTVWSRNVTNEFYLLSTPQLSADTTARYTGMPRTVGVSFSYRYF